MVLLRLGLGLEALEPGCVSVLLGVRPPAGSISSSDEAEQRAVLAGMIVLADVGDLGGKVDML